ncbi:MAG TPA: hypothetical protein VF884_00165 [Nitrososphaeraceae archaeon]
MSVTTILTPAINNVVDAPIRETDPLKRNNLIYSYFIESTGLLEVFRILFSSFIVSDDVLKLNRQDDSDLIELIKTNINTVFAKPASTVTPQLDELRYNAYWRLFGYKIRGKEIFPKAVNYNSEFNKTFELAMYNIFQMILDKGITTEKVGNPNATAELLDNLKRQLAGRTYNTIEDISQDSAFKLYSLVALLSNNKLMVERLNIRSEDPTRRLIELGEKLKVAVAKETSYLFLLAGRMNVFLRKVEEESEWDAKAATDLTSDENETFFKDIESSWFHVTGRSFLADALKARRHV